MDLWHTEIKNVSMRIWVGKWDEDVMWGHEKPNPRWIKMRGRSSKKKIHIAPDTLFPHVLCVERGRKENKCFCLLNVCRSHSYAKLGENEIYMYGGRLWGRHSLWKAGHRLELLTGWGVGINHATAVSSAGASSGLKRAVVSSCVLLPAPPPDPPSPLP